MTIVPRLRCYGCPRLPFLATQLLALARSTGALAPNGYGHAYSDFSWVAVERRFPAAAIETPADKGWAWYELKHSQAPAADLDALRLLAMFLAHWDNKSENQRLVCLDQAPAEAGDGGCQQPLAMIQDLGASFGPPKVNLARWRDLPVWHDRTRCTLSMRALPFEGATFEDVRVSESGRMLAAERLGAITVQQIERLFADARFPQFQAGTADERDLKAWTAAFRDRVRQIADARCTS